jgi:hypothetical protein
MKLLPFSLFFFTALLAGCVSPHTQMLDAPGEDRISPKDIVLVHLSPATRARTEGTTEPFGQRVELIQWQTGLVFARVFVGAEGDAEFSITKTECKNQIAGLGFTLRTTYTVDGILRAGGKEYPIHARGSRAAAMNTPSARRQAVELASVEAGKRCKEILEQLRGEAAR